MFKNIRKKYKHYIQNLDHNFLIFSEKILTDIQEMWVRMNMLIMEYRLIKISLMEINNTSQY